jgi:cytosine/adenosine deaminase-related metal-dependent hydrolase
MILENLVLRGTTYEVPMTFGTGPVRIVLNGDRIHAIQSIDQNYTEENKDRIQFSNAIALPGFINSHDHLDFNLFPLLANRVYNNYSEWAGDIQVTRKKEIEAVLRIPEEIRIEWGCYKNLLNGFTTVVNHGKNLEIRNSPVHVHQSCTSLHSTAFERSWKIKLNNPLNRKRVVAMHIGEGRDEMAEKEIEMVSRWNFLHKKIIAVHGIAMNKKQAELFKGLVWCPASNQKLIGETAEIEQLENVIPIVFGTDSTLSAGWNAWMHFRLGLREPGMNESVLLKMLTATPAELWDLQGKGILKANAVADIVITEQKADLFQNNPEDMLMVVQNGRIRLFDESLASQIQLPNFSKLSINKRVKFVEGDLPGLINRIRSWYPSIDLPINV